MSYGLEWYVLILFLSLVSITLFSQVLILHGAYLEAHGSVWLYDTEKMLLNLTIPTSQHNPFFTCKDILKEQTLVSE